MLDKWCARKSEAAVNLDGVDDYIDLPRLDLTGSTITLSAWARNSSFATGISQRFVKAADSTEDGTYWMLGQANKVATLTPAANGRCHTFESSMGKGCEKPGEFELSAGRDRRRSNLPLRLNARPHC